MFDQTSDGRRLKWLPICDEFSREWVTLEVERPMEAKDGVRLLERAVQQRGGPPQFIRSDHGPEFLAVQQRGFKTLYIKPGSPWQNAYSKSFNSRYRDEFLNRELFGCLLEAKVLGQDYLHHYNVVRPHSSLGYLTPCEYAAVQANRSAGGCTPHTPHRSPRQAFRGSKRALACPQTAARQSLTR